MRRVLLAAALALSGCSMQPVLMPAPSYESAVVVSSSKTADVSVVTGTVTGKGSSMIIPVVGAGVFVPVSTGPVERLMFGREDQEIFAAALRSELVRLGLFADAGGAGGAAGTEADARIRLDFRRTEHSPQFQSYALEVDMRIEGDKPALEKHYVIVSDDDAGFWEKANTNATQGKAKAGRKLMAALVPDIEAWLQQPDAEASSSGAAAPDALEVHQQQ